MIFRLLLMTLILGGTMIIPPGSAFGRVVAPASVAAEIDAKLLASNDSQGVSPAHADEIARDALALARRQPDRALLLRTLLQAAKMARLVANYPFVLQAANEGINLASSLRDDRSLAAFYQVRGTAQWNQASLIDATKSFVESLRIAEPLGDKELQLTGHRGLGLVCSRSDDEAGSMFHLNVALNLARELGDDAGLAAILNDLGNQYLQDKDYDQAKKDLEEALALSKGTKDQRFLAFLLLSLGQIATETGDQPLAVQYLDQSSQIFQASGIQRGIANFDYLMAGVERRSGQPDAALAHLQQALAIAETIKNPDLFASIYEECALTQEARGDFKSALDNQRKLTAQREIMRGERIRRHADEITARFANESRSREIKLLQRNKEIQQADIALKNAELSRARSDSYLLVALFALVAAALFAAVSRLWARVVRTRRILHETQAAKQEVEAADALKSRLLDAAALELSNSEARFRSAFQNSALGLALVSPQGNWMSVNAALCNTVGYTEEELTRMTSQEITHPDDLTIDADHVARLLRGDTESYHLEKRYFHKDGRLIWITLDVSLVRDSASGEPRYFISQVCDITADKEAAADLRSAKEDAERANNAKSEFLSRMSHELRTPLNAILGFGQLLGLQDLGRRPNESVNHILTAGQHLLGLIDEVLDLAKIESGKLDFARESAHVASLVALTLEMLGPLAMQAGVRLLPIKENDHVYAAAEQRRLRQILLNLVSNAIKYNRPGGEVAVRWRRVQDRIRIEVADTGPGIPPADLKKIGQPFARLTATESAPGTGLGLSLTRALTQAMGGEFSFTSEVGVGSVFRVDLDAADAPPEAPTDPVLESLLQDRPLPADRADVLYIEDNLTNLNLVEHLFADHESIRLLGAMKGRTGLDLAREHQPDLILLDLHLPDMAGETVLRLLREQPETAGIPVIVVSADATPASIERLKAAGARDYLTKPFDIGELRSAIREALEAGAVLPA